MVEAPNISILCVVKGSGPINITWQKGDRPIYIDEHSHLSVAEDGSLRILHARKKRDEGVYRCIATNKIGTIFSRRAKISFPCKYNFQ